MTRYERDECMRYIGQLEGLLAVIAPIEDENEEDTIYIFERIKEIAHDLECVVKGYDKPIPVKNLIDIRKGGDEDDV